MMSPPNIAQHLFAPFAVAHAQQALIVVLIIPVSQQQIQLDHLNQLIVAASMLRGKVQPCDLHDTEKTVSVVISTLHRLAEDQTAWRQLTATE